VQSAAETFRQNPKIDVATVITQLGVGEALVSLLEPGGTPSIVERAFMLPPHSKIGPISDSERQAIIQQSVIYGTYEKAVDRESAAEVLQARAQGRAASSPEAPAAPAGSAPAPAATASGPSAVGAAGGFLKDLILGSTGPRGGKHAGLADKMISSTVRTMGSTVGREIIRGVLGSLFGSKRR
jgi:hypothetical protein